MTRKDMTSQIPHPNNMSGSQGFNNTQCIWKAKRLTDTVYGNIITKERLNHSAIGTSAVSFRSISDIFCRK